MTDFSSRLSALSEEERLRLLDLLDEEIDEVQPDTIPRRGETEPLLLSFAQQRLWFLDQLLENGAVYTIPEVFRLEGPLDIPALEQVFHTIVQRHEVLRTTFRQVAGNPLQVIAPVLSFPFPLIDLEATPRGQREAYALHLAGEEARRPFDLTQGPLLRTTLVRLAPQEHLLIFTLHHIVSDGWSTGVLLQEMTALYAAFVKGEVSPLPALPIQYADFALWQRQWLQGAVLEDQLNYWRQQLGGVLPVLELPTDHPRSPSQTYRGSVEAYHLPPRISEQLQLFCQQEGVTLFMVLLAAFQILLYRYSGQEDILLGSAIANRNRTEIEPLIGFFVNMLVLRTNLAGNPHFRAVLQQVKETTLDAYAHQDVPFEKLVEALQPRRDPSRSPLFQVTLTVQNAPIPPLVLSELIVSAIEVETDTSHFDLGLIVTEESTGMLLEAEYKSDLFEPDTIHRLLEHFQILLEGLVAHPERHIADVPLLSQAERQQILIDWNQTARPQQSQELHCLHERFAAQAHHTPEAVAVMFGQEQVRYEQLNQRANQLAHYLRSLGVGPETLVGLCVERSLEMIVGILGILKAGGAYVPLDPAYPQERLAFMLQDTQVPVLVTQEHLSEILPLSQGTMVCLDREWSEISQCSTEDPISGAVAENVAYVIYTSGSTGKPKGVLIEHRAASNFITSTIELFAVSPADRVLQFATFCFDVSVFEVFTALLSGALLCLIPRETLLSPTALAELMRQQQITIIDIPPAVMTLLPAAAFPDLRIVLVGGESFSADLVNQWALPGRRFFNGYGPTESTVTMTLMECHASSHQSPPIGRPMPNHQVYILDPQLHPVPIGIPGELHIGGLGLARGYLNRQDITATKFIPNPFNQQENTRLYKSGDVVRYLSDGNIEFLGRIDNQVKVRGYRIELGEIEAVLLQHPTIQQAVVMVREDTLQDKHLIAYVCAQKELLPNVSELRNFLTKYLPVYMLPSVFMFLEQLPLLSSGKVNYKALPLPDAVRPDLDTSFILPRTPIEQSLADDIFSDILGVKRVGIYDNFFELGGNSLQLIRLRSRLRDLFQLEIPLKTFFENSTIAGLAELIEQQADETPSSTRRASQSPLIAIQQAGSKRPLFCIHPVGGSVFCYIDLARHLGTDQPLYGFQAAGLEGEQDPLTQIESMADRYVEAMHTLQPDGPYQLLGWSMGGIVAFEMARQLKAKHEEVVLLCLLDVSVPVPDTQPSNETDLVEEFLDDIVELSGKELPSQVQMNGLKLNELKPEEEVIWVVEQAKRIGSIPADIDITEMKHRLNVFKANSRAMSKYVSQDYAGPLTLFRAEETQKRSTAWSKLTLGRFHEYSVPGSHYTMLTEPHIRFLAAQLQKAIDEE